jgi:hypothetical protein
VILIVLALLCVVTVPLTGGSLSRLGDLRLRWLWAAPAALAVQVVIVTIAPGGSETLHAATHIGTYVLIGVFLWANRAVVGVPIIGLGTLLNTLAIVCNGGVMPASVSARRIAGLTTGAGFHNSAIVHHPHLLWFGDIIPVPGPLPNTLSAGDCLIFTGMLVLLHVSCRARPRAGVHLSVPLPSSPSTSAAAALRVTVFEQIHVAPEVALLRLTMQRDDADGLPVRPTLVVHDGQSSHRLAPLPAPHDTDDLVRAGYRLPAWAAAHGLRFALELGPDRLAVALPAPTLRPLPSA